MSEKASPKPYEPPQPLVGNILYESKFNLTPWALEELAKSRVTAETARLHQVRSVPRMHGRNDSCWYPLLNRRWLYEWGECLLFPHFDAVSGIEFYDRACYYVRMKPQWPDGTSYYDESSQQLQHGDKRPKYIGPAGHPLRLYFTNDVISGLKNKTLRRVYVTEGEKKALYLWQIGRPAISLPGVDPGRGMTSGMKSKYHLHSDLQRFDWNGVEVCIVFDSDAALNDNIEKARKKLASAFQKVGAAVLIVPMPDEAADPANFNGDKVAIDDYGIKYGDEATRKLLDDCAVLLQPEKPTVSSVDSEVLVEDYISGREQPTHCWQKFYEYDPDRHVYVAREDEEVESEMYKWLCAIHRDVKSAHAVELRKGVKYRLHLPLTQSPPLWIGDPPSGFENLDECFVGTEQILNLRSGQTTPNTPELFATHAVPVAYDPAVPAPEMFLGHLAELLQLPHQIAIAQEYLGSLLTSDTRLQKFMMLIGPPGCGKGTLMRVVEHLLGSHNIYGTSLFDFNGRFGLAPAVGKSLLVVNDAKLPKDSSVAHERINNIVGEDLLTVEDKYEKLVSVRLKLKIIVVGNTLLNFQDVAFSMGRRMLPLQAYGSEHRKPVDGLSEMIFERESSGILNWMIEGWRRVTTCGFTEMPEDGPGRELLAVQRQLGSPTAAFIDEQCVVGAGKWVRVNALFDRWRSWAEANNHYPGSPQSFGAKLLAAAHGVRRSRRRFPGPGGESLQESVYEGIALQGASHESCQEVPY